MDCNESKQWTSAMIYVNWNNLRHESTPMVYEQTGRSWSNNQDMGKSWPQWGFGSTPISQTSEARGVISPPSLFYVFSSPLFLSLLFFKLTIEEGGFYKGKSKLKGTKKFICGRQSPLATSWTVENQGKRFYKCTNLEAGVVAFFDGMTK